MLGADFGVEPGVIRSGKHSVRLQALRERLGGLAAGTIDDAAFLAA
jgi:hypothetical protein